MLPAIDFHIERSATCRRSAGLWTTMDDGADYSHSVLGRDSDCLLYNTIESEAGMMLALAVWQIDEQTAGPLKCHVSDARLRPIFGRLRVQELAGIPCSVFVLVERADSRNTNNLGRLLDGLIAAAWFRPKVSVEGGSECDAMGEWQMVEAASSVSRSVLGGNKSRKCARRVYLYTTFPPCQCGVTARAVLNLPH